jgi:hypothetical protein
MKSPYPVNEIAAAIEALESLITSDANPERSESMAEYLKHIAKEYGLKLCACGEWKDEDTFHDDYDNDTDDCYDCNKCAESDRQYRNHMMRAGR